MILWHLARLAVLRPASEREHIAVCAGCRVLIADNDILLVERQLRQGRLSCPSCGPPLAPWGHDPPPGDPE